MKDHKVVIWNVVLITFSKGLPCFLLPGFVYKAFGLHGAHIYDVVMLQAVVSVSVDMLPLPGVWGSVKTCS